MEIGGEYGLNYRAGTLVNGSIYCPFYEDRRVIRINTAAMDVSSLDLPSLPSWINDYWQVDFTVGDTKDGELSMHLMIFTSMFGSVVWTVMELGFRCRCSYPL